MTPSERSARPISKPSRKRRAESAVATKTRHRSLRDLTGSRAKTPKTNKPTLLTLPDEPLTQIIALLSTQTPSFQPPPAFYLAQTNTRFLNIFSALLTRITPYTSNPTPLTLSTTHLAAVSRIAGKHLRAIHLPEGALWYELPDDCPHVEELSFRDDSYSDRITRQLLRRLPLKILEVYRPCVETLCIVNMPLEKLVLKEVCISNIKPLLTILRTPPKELVLQLEDMREARMKRIMNALDAAIPRMEKVSVSTPSKHEPCRFHEDIRTMVHQLRESGRTAKCTMASLSGPETFHFLRLLDASASVTLSYGPVEYRCDHSFECRIIKLPLRYNSPELDFTYLEELTLYENPNPEWMVRLPRLRHINVLCEGVLPAVSADIATVPIPKAPFAEWNLPSRELRFVARHLSESEVLGFCETLVEILSRFSGNVVWMEFVRGYDIGQHRDSLRRCVRCTKYCCEKFAERGGDAGTVLAWLDDVFARCF